MNEIDFVIYALGFIAVGLVIGVPLGEVLERRRNRQRRVKVNHTPFVLSKREAEIVAANIRKFSHRRSG